MNEPTYGASRHYLGDKGQEYFGWQDAGGVMNGQIEARKFRSLVRPEHTVLDFGCGAGNVLRALECARKIGIEINPAARERCEAAGIESYADLAEIPDGIVDVAITNHALEHVPAPVEAMRQIRRTMKPGGWFSACVPITEWRVERGYDPNDLMHHLNSWTMQLFGNSLMEAGFQVDPSKIKILTLAWPPHHHAMYRSLPEPVFDAVCRVWSVLLKRRQIIAVARAS